MAARSAAPSRTNARPLSYDTFSHLCASVAHESASAMPSTRCARDGAAAAHRPKAPSTWTHAPASCAAAHAARSGSDAPEFTLPACAQTIAGPSSPRQRLDAHPPLEAPDGAPHVVDARPSDAISLALAAGAPIRVAEEVMQLASETRESLATRIPSDGEVLDGRQLGERHRREHEELEAEREEAKAAYRARRAGRSSEKG